MKNELLTSFVELEKNELQQLCRIVKETLATGIVMPQAEEKNLSVLQISGICREA